MKGIDLNLNSLKVAGRNLVSETDPKISEGPQFGQALLKGMGEVNQSINQSQKMTQEFLTDGKHNLHEVIISLEKADVSFRFMTQVRNKVLDAYNEVMRMPI